MPELHKRLPAWADSVRDFKTHEQPERYQNAVAWEILPNVVWIWDNDHGFCAKRDCKWLWTERLYPLMKHEDWIWAKKRCSASNQPWWLGTYNHKSIFLQVQQKTFPSKTVSGSIRRLQMISCIRWTASPCNSCPLRSNSTWWQFA